MSAEASVEVIAGWTSPLLHNDARDRRSTEGISWGRQVKGRAKNAISCLLGPPALIAAFWFGKMIALQ